MRLKKVGLLLSAVVICATFAAADQITFSFIGSSASQTLDAGLGSFTAGPALNVLVTDVTTGVTINLPGIFTTSTGIANSFTVLTSPNLVLANYSAGGSSSVLITSPDGKTDYVAGVNQDHGTFISGYPNGTGAFLNNFDVTAVDPAVLAMFGLGPGFDAQGSVSITSGGGNLLGPDNLGATVGGGSVTVQTTPVVEPARQGLVVLGGLGIAAIFRRKIAAWRSAIEA